MSEVLKTFPTSVFNDRKLTVLSLDGSFEVGVPIKVPRQLGELKRLRELYLGNNDIRELPDTIGKLVKLEVLDVSNTYRLARLPSSLGKLRALRTLELGYATGLKELPSTIGGCESLESLNPDDSPLRSVPASLWSCTNLRDLRLPQTVKRLPPGIAKLTKLERLHAHPDAVWSVRSELSKLTTLRDLRLVGQTTRIADEVGRITSLRTLQIVSARHVKVLPSTIGELPLLERLEVSGAGLESLASVVASLPRLKFLSFARNELARSEQRTIEALMRLPPTKRRSTARALQPASKTAKPTRLGQVFGDGLLVVDASVSSSYTGVGDSEDGEPRATDWNRFEKAVVRKTAVPLAVGRGQGIAIASALSLGEASVFEIDNAIVIVEMASEEEVVARDPVWREYLGSPPEGVKFAGQLAVPTGALVIMPSTDSCADVPKQRAKMGASRAKPCGSENAGLLVKVPKGNYDLLVEKVVERSFGSTRRIVIQLIL